MIVEPGRNKAETNSGGPQIASALTREEIGVLRKPGWQRDAGDQITLDKLAQKHTEALSPAPVIPSPPTELTPSTVSPVVESSPAPLPEREQVQSRFDNLRARGWYTEQFNEVDTQRELQNRANRIQLDPVEAAQLNDFRARMHRLEEESNAGRPLSGNDQTELDYYHHRFAPEVAEEQKVRGNLESGMVRLAELRQKEGSQMTASDRFDLEILEEEYGKQLNAKNTEKRKAVREANAADRDLATRAREAATRIEAANATIQEARATNPLVQPDVRPEDIEATNAYNRVVGNLRGRANGFGEPLTAEEQARLARLEAAYAIPPVAPERIPIPAEPDMTTILGRVEDGIPLSPEDQVIHDAWTARHADVINPGQIGAPETSEPTSPVENIGEPPEANPNPLEERPTADVDAEETEEAERRNAAYNQVMEKVRKWGVVLTDEDRRIIREHDDAVLHAPTTPAPAPPTDSATRVPSTSAEAAAATSRGGGGEAPAEAAPTIAVEIIPAPPGFIENLKRRAQDMVNNLRDKADEYRNSPVRLVRDAGNMLKEGVHSWWDGVMPVDWFHSGEPNYLKRWQFANLVFYYGGVAGGTVIDIVSLFPGLGLLRPALKVAIGVAAPIAMGRSERAKLASIDAGSASVEEKARQKAEIQEKYSKANKFILNTAHGIAAGMVASTLIQGAESVVSNLFKPKVEAPVNVPPVIPGPESLTYTPPTDATFKVVDYHGFWKPEGLDSLGAAARNWGITTAQGQDKQAIIGMILRQNAHRFGAVGDTLRITDLGPNSQELITLLGRSNTQAEFLSNGGQQLINLIAKGQN